MTNKIEVTDAYICRIQDKWFNAGKIRGRQEVLTEVEKLLKETCFKDCLNEDCQKDVLKKLKEMK